MSEPNFPIIFLYQSPREYTVSIVTGHHTILKIMAKKYSDDLCFPPECLKHMDMEFLRWDSENKSLVARTPLKEAFQNPRKFMQGGFVVAALDNVLGPLSYLSDTPSVTTQLNTTFVRPVDPHFDYIEIKAVIIDQTTSKIFSSAEARSPAGKLLATVQTSSHIISR